LFKKKGDSRFSQSSFMCSLFVDYCLSALFCPLSIRFRINASECPFGNFILLKNIISDRQPVLVYYVVMQASQLIWRPMRWWSYGCWIYNYLCSQYLSQIKLCDKNCQWFRIPLMASFTLSIIWSSLSVTLNSAHGKQHSIHYLIKFVSDFESRSWQAALYT